MSFQFPKAGLFVGLLGAFAISLITSYALTVSDSKSGNERWNDFWFFHNGGDIRSDTHLTTLILTGLLLSSLFCYHEFLLTLKNRASVLACALFSLFGAGILSVGSRIVYRGWIFGDSSYVDILPFGAWQLIVFLSSFTYFFFILRAGVQLLPKFQSLVSGRGGASILGERPFFFFFGVLFFCWVPYLLALYPGVITPDTITSLKQSLGDIPLQNDHPLLFTYILSIFVRSEFDINLGCFLFSLFQTVISGLALSYCLCWLLRKGVGELFILFCLGYFALMPVFPIYSITLQKDTLYTISLLVFSLKSADAFCYPKSVLVRDLFCLIGLGLLVCYLRHNGIYVVAGTLLVLTVTFFLKGVGWRMLIGSAMFSTLVFLLGYPLFNIAKREHALAFSIPIQQLTRTVFLDKKSDSDKTGFGFSRRKIWDRRPTLAGSDLEFLSKILPLDFYSQYYTPATADPIKLNDHFNQEFFARNRGEFLSLWIKNMPEHFSTYTDSYILSTFGFWFPKVKSHFGFLDISCDPTYSRPGTGLLGESFYDLERVDLIDLISGSDFMRNILNRRNFLGPGSLFWLVALGGFFAYMNRRKTMLFLFFPSVVSFLTIMASAPNALSLRFVLIFAYGLPVFLLAGFLSTHIERGDVPRQPNAS